MFHIRLSFALCLLVLLPARVSALEILVPSPSATIQAAIDIATDGDTVKVSPGRYLENLLIDRKSITLCSANPEDAAVVSATVIDGQNKSACIIVRNIAGEPCVVSGFTVTNGGSSENTTERGGVFCENSKLSLRSNVITGNSGGAGGGVSCRGSDVLLKSCLLVGNKAYTGGALYADAGSACTISSCGIIGNECAALGAGILSASRSIEVLDTQIIGNLGIVPSGGITQGGGITVRPAPGLGRAMIFCRNCEISENWAAPGGGILLNGSDAIIENCRFVGNIVGAIYSTGESFVCSNSMFFANRDRYPSAGRSCILLRSCSPAVITNSLICGNTAGVTAEDTLLNLSNDTVVFNGSFGSANVGCTILHATNSIFYPAGIFVSDPSSTSIGHSSVSNAEVSYGPGNIVNITNPPLFVDPGYWDTSSDPYVEPGWTFVLGDYHLLPGSPSIDAGTNDVDSPYTPEVETLPATDLAGIPRVIDGNRDGCATVDMGAYEYLPGDVNNDGKVNVLDLILVRNSIGRDPASFPAARKADLNNDGKVNVLDLIAARNGLQR